MPNNQIESNSNLITCDESRFAINGTIFEFVEAKKDKGARVLKELIEDLALFRTIEDGCIL